VPSVCRSGIKCSKIFTARDTKPTKATAPATLRARGRSRSVGRHCHCRKPAIGRQRRVGETKSEESRTVVATVPVPRPARGFVVKRARSRFIRSPETTLRARASCSTPNRKTARPPTMPRMIFSGLIFSSSEEDSSFSGFPFLPEQIEQGAVVKRRPRLGTNLSRSLRTGAKQRCHSGFSYRLFGADRFPPARQLSF
jgi:hypothetical protein